MAEPNKRFLQAQDIKQYLKPIGDASTWIGDRKTLAAFASWTYKVREHDNLGAHNSPGDGFLDYRAGLPRPKAGDTSYDGAAFLHQASATLVLASRGSETLEDWITNAKAALGLNWKQIGPAIGFAADSVRAARDIIGGDLSQVLVTGNSLGGACAEAQAALLNAELKRRGQSEVKKISGFCDGSAAFGKNIKDYAAATYGALPAATFNLKSTVQHLIREHDPIRGQHQWLNGELLGAIDDGIASIFVVNATSERSGNGKGIPIQRWELQADASNHNDFYYFRFIAIDDTFHIIKPKSSDFFSEPGDEPKQKRFKLDALPEKYR